MKTILEKINDNAEQYPERIAYRVELLKGYEQFDTCMLTWNELNLYSDKLAFYLESYCITHSPIVVYGHKDPYMLVCFLACVKSGRAYCPIDISVPLYRVEAIINEVKPEVVFAVEELPLTINHIWTKEFIVKTIESEQSVIGKDKYVSAEDIFYIIFTSGSTGTPKGVQITRECLDNFIYWAITLRGGVNENEHYTFLNQAPFSFDLSVMDLYLSLYTGGTLWALTKEIQGNMKSLLQAFARSNANVWVSTPSFADVCLSDKKFSKELLPSLQLFLFCGEVLTNLTVERLETVFPETQIVNLYGPTESTCAVTEIHITPQVRKKYNPLPIGKEKEGTWIFIVDENENIVSDGKKGEIVIVGNTVSTGYWNQPALTSKSFGTYEIGNKKFRLYRTGDKGYKKEGLIYYCGRIDSQIKLHGYRIEIEDIESNFMKLENVSKVAVVPLYHEGQVKRLVAYVVPREKISDAFAAAQCMRNELKVFLPDYMIPQKIIFLEQLPMTNNGKVDKRLLGSDKS